MHVFPATANDCILQTNSFGLVNRHIFRPTDKNGTAWLLWILILSSVYQAFQFQLSIAFQLCTSGWDKGPQVHTLDTWSLKLGEQENMATVIVIVLPWGARCRVDRPLPAVVLWVTAPGPGGWERWGRGDPWPSRDNGHKSDRMWGQQSTGRVTLIPGHRSHQT